MIPPSVIETAAKFLGGLIFRAGWEGGKNAMENLNENTQNLVFQASRQYVEKYIQRHGTLKVLGMRDPVSLDSIYTAVQFLSETEILRLASTVDLEDSFRQSSQRGFSSRDREKISGLKVASEKPRLMILGAPGAGKSTLLRKVGLEALKGDSQEYKPDCLPIFIELKRLTEKESDIQKILIEELRVCGFPYPERIIENFLKEGKLLILFDGLDEVPTDNLSKVIQTIQDFVNKHDRNRFIASCRIAAYRGGFNCFNDVMMADFDDGQIEQFIRNWFQKEKHIKAKTAEKCWEKLQSSEYESTKELAHNPLLLTFLCLVYRNSQDFPKNRSKLYQKALRILLEEWSAEKQLTRDTIYEGFHTELEEILLSEIAYDSFKHDRLFFEKRDIVKQIKDFLAGNLNAPQHLNGEAVLRAIAVQQGILVERAVDIYSFSHLTLQEYLTAQYIVDHNLIEDSVKNHVTDIRWREVFLLVAGLLNRGADELLLAMERQANKFLLTPVGSEKLVPILRWADEITKDSESEIKGVGKRAIAYAYVYAYANANANVIANANAIAKAYAYVYAYAYASAYASTIASAIIRFIELAQRFNQDKIFANVDFSNLIFKLEVLSSRIPDDGQPREVRIEFFRCFINTWLSAFHLDLNLVKLSEEELGEIDRQYFYVNYLIIKCKESAVRVTPQTWEGIEERMLKVPD